MVEILVLIPKLKLNLKMLLDFQKLWLLCSHPVLNGSFCSDISRKGSWISLLESSKEHLHMSAICMSSTNFFCQIPKNVPFEVSLISFRILTLGSGDLALNARIKSRFDSLFSETFRQIYIQPTSSNVVQFLVNLRYETLSTSTAYQLFSFAFTSGMNSPPNLLHFLLCFWIKLIDFLGEDPNLCSPEFLFDDWVLDQKGKIQKYRESLSTKLTGSAGTYSSLHRPLYPPSSRGPFFLMCSDRSFHHVDSLENCNQPSWSKSLKNYTLWIIFIFLYSEINIWVWHVQSWSRLDPWGMPTSPFHPRASCSKSLHSCWMLQTNYF